MTNRTHVSYMGVKLSEQNFASYAPDALKGYWARKWEGNVRLTVVKGHAMLSSDIMEADTQIVIELPQHRPFYLNVLSASGSRNVLIENDINITLSAGEQASAVFTTEV